LKHIKALILIILLIMLTLVAACSPSEPDAIDEAAQEQSIQGGVILHAFCWSFNIIAENMADIAAAGYTAVQTSPITECIITHPQGGEGMNIGGPNGFWWYHYQPVSFNIGNFQLGTEEEFENMCRIADEYNVKIIVDAVVNHCAASYDCISDEIKNIPGGAFHAPARITGSGRYQATQRQLLGLWDLNTQNPYVQQEVLNLLKRCIELGASGFRYDAAYHIELPEDNPAFASDFWPVVLDNGAEFQYGEVLGSAEAEVYAKYMNVTDAGYGHTIVSAVRSGLFNASAMQRYSVNAPASQLVTWVESHDTFCNAGETSDLTEKQILYGWAVLCARNDSTPLYLSRPAGSSPGVDNRWGNNIVGERGNDAFKSPEVVALNHFKTAMAGTGEYFSNPTDSDRLLMIERGSTGVVIINTGEQTVLSGVTAHLMIDGVYNDVISGNEFTVMDGKLSGTVNAETVVVFYKEGYPSVSLSQGSADFFDDTITLTVSAVNVDEAVYSINDGASIPYESGYTLTLGADMEIDETVTITLTGTSGKLDEPLVRVYSFAKRNVSLLNDDTVVFYINTEGWDEVYCYVYSTSFEHGVLENNRWPGEPMTHVSGDLYTYVLPEWDEFYVMFNNNAGEQFPLHNAPGLRMSRGQHMILDGVQLVPYVP